MEKKTDRHVWIRLVGHRARNTFGYRAFAFPCKSTERPQQDASPRRRGPQTAERKLICATDPVTDPLLYLVHSYDIAPIAIITAFLPGKTGTRSPHRLLSGAHLCSLAALQLGLDPNISPSELVQLLTRQLKIHDRALDCACVDADYQFGTPTWPEWLQASLETIRQSRSLRDVPSKPLRVIISYIAWQRSETDVSVCCVAWVCLCVVSGLPYCKYPVHRCTRVYPSSVHGGITPIEPCMSHLLTHPSKHPPTASHHASLQTARHTTLMHHTHVCLWCRWVLRTPPTQTPTHTRGTLTSHRHPVRHTQHTRGEAGIETAELPGRSVGRSVGRPKKRKDERDTQTDTHTNTPQKQDEEKTTPGVDRQSKRRGVHTRAIHPFRTLTHPTPPHTSSNTHTPKNESMDGRQKRQTNPQPAGDQPDGSKGEGQRGVRAVSAAAGRAKWYQHG